MFDHMPFGKYKGELIGTVIENNPGYMQWAVNSTDLRLDDSALTYLEDCSDSDDDCGDWRETQL